MTVTNTVAPTVSGSAVVGQLLSTSNGTWTHTDPVLSYAYRWLRCNAAGASCSAIGGATSNSYRVVSADVGSTIRSEVTATESATPSPPGEPPAIAGDGYSVVFEDNFNTLDTSVWRLGNWYDPEEPTDVFVDSGVMKLVSRQSEGNPSRGAMTKSGHSWQEGYFECRMRWTANVNAFPAFWMMSENWITTGNCTSIKVSEYDIFEAFETGYPNNHSGALHRNTTGPCGQSDAVQQVYTTDVGDAGVTTPLAGQWHVYAGLWTATTVSWYVDDILLGSKPTYSSSAQPMRLFLQMGSHASAGVDLVSEFDWVRVWQQ